MGRERIFKVEELPPAMRAEYERLYGKNAPGASPAAGGINVPTPASAPRIGHNPGGPAASPRLKQRTGPKLNKTEALFLEYLKRLHPAPAEVHPQEVTLVLANGVRYTVDFMVFLAEPIDGFRMIGYETKGHMRDDAAVKIKMAADRWRMIRWVLVTKARSSARHILGDWVMQTILPL